MNTQEVRLIRECPFCGCDDLRGNFAGGDCIPTCGNKACMAQGPKASDSEASVKRWNTRAPSPATVALVEAVKVVMKELTRKTFDDLDKALAAFEKENGK